MLRSPANFNTSDDVALTEPAQDVLVSLGTDGMVRTWNAAATRLFGYDASEAIGQSVSFFADLRQREDQNQFLENARAGKSSGPIETTRRRKDGSEVVVELTVTPVRDEQGRVVSVAGALRDISGRKKADLQFALVTNELTHRLKNTLTRVQSIAMQTLRDATSLDAFSSAFNARLAALASSHDLLTKSAGKNVALADLVTAELAPHGASHASGAPVLLDSAQVLPLGMILHELATNAAKHGAFSVPTGQVSVSWQVKQVEDAERLILIWSEKDGPAVGQPTRKGFGTRLIANCVANELGGDLVLAFERTGVVCKIDIPRSAVGQE